MPIVNTTKIEFIRKVKGTIGTILSAISPPTKEVEIDLTLDQAGQLLHELRYAIDECLNHQTMYRIRMHNSDGKGKYAHIRVSPDFREEEEADETTDETTFVG